MARLRLETMSAALALLAAISLAPTIAHARTLRVKDRIAALEAYWKTPVTRDLK